MTGGIPAAYRQLFREARKLKKSAFIADPFDGSKSDLERSSGIAYLPLMKSGKGTRGMLILRDCEMGDINKLEILGIQLSLHIEKTTLYEIVRHLSIIDGLTRIYLRRQLMNLLESEIARLKERKLPLSLLMIDIDNFKQINDEFGHLAGDRILRQLSSLMAGNLRQMDFIGRYGGEEFIIVLPETEREIASTIAERFRKAIMKHEFELFQEKHKLTVSIGASFLKGEKSTMDSLIEEADKALYAAKASGKNCVVMGK